MTPEEARAILSGPKSYASVRDLSPDTVALTVIAQKTNLWPLTIITSIVGLVSIAAGLLLLRKPSPDWLAGPMSDAPVKLLIPGFLCTVFAPMILLIRLVTGPPRNVELEASPGQIKADRSIAGDRVCSTYSRNDVLCLFIESEVLFIETRMGQSQLIAFGNASVNQAIGFLLAHHFWFPEEISAQRIRRPFMSRLPERVVFIPRPH